MFTDDCEIRGYLERKGERAKGVGYCARAPSARLPSGFSRDFHPHPALWLIRTKMETAELVRTWRSREETLSVDDFRTLRLTTAHLRCRFAAQRRSAL